jgi:hypothetical protein
VTSTPYRPDGPASAIVAALAETVAAANLSAELGAASRYGPGQQISFGPPIIPDQASAVGCAALAVTLVRALQHLVEKAATEPTLSDLLALPRFVRDELRAEAAPETNCIHLARVDLLLPPGEPARAIEGNANCPGGLHFAGTAAASWRRLAGEAGTTLPSQLPHEGAGWLADWYVATATAATGEWPEQIALLYEPAGNALEMVELADALRARGVGVVTADPRAVTTDGGVRIAGEPIRHAYLKLGMRRLAERWSELGPLRMAIRDGRLFVQNGLRGRWIGDNKRCLAVLSDPRHSDLLPAELRATAAALVPWTRGTELLGAAELDDIGTDKNGYVLKSPYGTRGQGVVIGPSTEPTEWRAALATAVRDRWLVQRHTSTAPYGSDGLTRHDLSVAVSGDRVVGALARSGPSAPLNVAHQAQLHPVYLHRAARSEGARA